MLCVSSAVAKETYRVVYNPENTLIGFQFDKGKLKTEQSIIDLFGEGCKKGDIRKYMLQNEDVVIEFDVQGPRNFITGVGLSRGNANASKCISKNNIGPLETGKGLKLGDDSSRVLQLYGLPVYMHIGERYIKEFSSLALNKMRNYTAYYADDIIFESGADLANGIPPHSQMMIKVCEGRVCEIGLVVWSWSNKGEIIPRGTRVPELDFLNQPATYYTTVQVSYSSVPVHDSNHQHLSTGGSTTIRGSTNSSKAPTGP